MVVLCLPSIRLFAEEPTKFGLELRNTSLLQRNYADPALGDTLEGSNLLNLRGKIEAHWDEHWGAELHGVQEAFIRSRNNNFGFSGFTFSGSNAGFVVDDLVWEQADENAVLLRLFPDRFNLHYGGERFGFTVGRQAVNFSRTFFWSPNDWLSPYTPNTLDRSYKPGVDLLRADYWLQPLQGLSLFYALGDEADFSKSALVAKFNQSWPQWDVDLLVGKVRDEFRAGLGAVCTESILGGGALRAELSYYSDAFVRATLGYDRQFTRRWLMLAEYHYNGLGATDSNDYNRVSLDPHVINGEISSLAQDYLGINNTIEITPLFKLELGGILNAVDGSTTLSPGFTYSVADEVELRGNSLIALGSHPDLSTVPATPQSEYGSYPSFFWLELILAL